ncbi:type II secretion system protein GspD [Vibrio lentus]
MRKMKTALCSALLALLVGCTSQAYDDNERYNAQVQQDIAEKTTHVTRDKVVRSQKPPQFFAPIEDEVQYPWLDEVVTASASELPLSVVLEEIMAGVDVPLYFSEGTNPNAIVSLNFSNTREHVLNALSRDVGYGIAMRDGRLEVSSTVTQTFFLNIPSGTMNGQLGSQGGGGEEDEVSIEGQYLNAVYNDVKVADEIRDAIINILGKDEGERVGSVTASINMSTVTVTTSPDRMVQVERLIEHYREELSKQVLLDVRVIEFRSNLGTERGVDWNLAYESGDGVLQFFIHGTNTVSQEAGYGFAFQGTGKWSGTEALIKVLEKQGSVSTETPITAILLNNQPAHISQQSLVPYVYETSSDSSEGVVSTSVTRREEVEGVDFMAVANVQADHVYLRMSGQLQKIASQETKTVANVELGFLTKSKAEITVPNKLRYGQTYVVASVKQTSRTNEKTKSFWTTFFGGTGSNNTTVETLVLLTPRQVQ